MRRGLMLGLLATVGAVAVLLWTLGRDDAPPAPEVGTDCSTWVSIAARAGSAVDFRGGFEDGLRAWDGVQRAAPDRIRTVAVPVAEGRAAGRFETRPADSLGDTDPRAEVYARVGAREGAEQYYSWFTYFPEDFPTAPREFVTFTQWRAVDESDAWTSFMAWGDRLELRRGGVRWSAPLERGRWHEFVYHVRWSPDPEVGFIELCHDGQVVLPRTPVRTMGGTVGDGIENYLKQGLYKSPDLPTGVLYHDGMVVTGRSRSGRSAATGIAVAPW